MSYTEWNIKKQSESSIRALSSAVGCGQTAAYLLLNRKISDPDAARRFLNPDSERLHAPFLMPDMKAAANRIIKAVNDGEKICIYGDYDVDGITSVSVLYLYLKHFTDNVTYFIPDRFSHGYGVNEDAVNEIAKDGCKLIVTVDTGITALGEVKAAVRLGIDFVVTDHHECQNELPPATAVVNPKRTDSTYPFKSLAGVGVVYKLITALDSLLGVDLKDENIDLVAIGTIADIMSLTDENRKIVFTGLEKMAKSPNMGLKKLIDLCSNGQINSASVGFTIAPRINAAGRMASAHSAVMLFISSSESEAEEIAKYLCDLNSERQRIEASIYEQAIDIIETHDLDRRCSVLVLWKEGWHNGVIGIVASKLKEKYHKPVVLFSVEERAKGSARSLESFNIFDAFDSMKDTLIRYGGHKYAAGVLVENYRLYELRDRLCARFDGMADKMHAPYIDVECVITEKQLNIKTVSEISRLQPFGKDNDVPLFCIRGAKIAFAAPTVNNRHLRLKLDINGKSVTCFYFGVSENEFDYREGDIVDIVCEMCENEYKNTKSVQLIVRDMRLPRRQLEANKNRRIFCDRSNDIIPSMLPSRDDIGKVYKYISHSVSLGKTNFNLDNIKSIICKKNAVNMNYEQIYFSVKILLELEIVSGFIDDETLIVTDVPCGLKVSLYDSKLLMSAYEKAGVEFGN